MEGWLREIGARLDAAQLDPMVVWALRLAAVAVAAWLSDFAARRLVVRGIRILARRTRITWDDALIENHVFHRLSHLAPAFVVHLAAPALFPDVEAQEVVRRLVLVAMILVGASVASAFLGAVRQVYHRYPISREKPITAYVQVARILLWILAGIVVAGRLLDREVWGLLTGLGALSAVIMLVFKDSILGFVASIQLSAYDMVRVGDWIEMPRYGADGDVVAVTLNTVKVRNWDKTITTIPTYALIADAFKNWRGMAESGGRRIKRAVRIDLHSIRLCTPEMLERFRKIEYIAGYLREKEEEVARWNEEHGVAPGSIVNGRRLTNVGVFRAYVEAYLRHHPRVRQDMTFLIRQLPPDEKGLPLEIYVFSEEQRWAPFEAIQADLFDHILAVVAEFDLRVFQEPSGADFRVLAARVS